ncbi:response regulator [Pedobacter jamesrossensis]|uniref:Response regulator n=1 Tax=Pedobacter jamesrossensis TaxID=1908238 RepID=A0ABV8NPP5_9SPHI
MKNIILVVDDDSMVLFIHEMVIEESNLTAKTEYFLSAGDALHRIAAESDSDACFLIFLDINMPILNGWQMLERLSVHQKREKIHVVMVSSSIDQVDVEMADSNDMVLNYLSKPLKEEDLERLKEDKLLAPFFTANT